MDVGKREWVEVYWSVSRFSFRTGVGSIGLVLGVARPAYADDCSALGDCWGWLITAALVLAVLVVLTAMFWEMFVAAAAIDAAMLATEAVAEGEEAVMLGAGTAEGAEAAEALSEAEEVTRESSDLARLQKLRDLIGDPNWFGGDKNCVPIAIDIAQKIAGQQSEYVFLTTIGEGMTPEALAARFGNVVTDATFESIASALTAAGPGSQGFVCVYTYEVIGGDLVAFAHAMNVVNDAGSIIFINAQPEIAVITTSGAEAAAASGYTVDYLVKFIPLFQIF